MHMPFSQAGSITGANRRSTRSWTRCVVIAAISATTATTLCGCATKPPPSERAAAAADGTGAQTIRATGVRGFLGIFAPYRISIQQGNFVSSEMLSQLKEGMTPEQVRFALGTPLLTDLFHSDRWDYIFRLQRGSGEVTTSRVTVFFKDDKLVRYEGGNLPTESEYLARISGASR
jgi:outer membrane protein assembly factor BamE